MSEIPDAVRLHPNDHPDRVDVYPHPRPHLVIRHRGRWYTAELHARYQYRDGRIGYQLTIDLGPQPGGASTQDNGTFLWDPQSFRVSEYLRNLPPGKQPWRAI